MNIKEKKEIIIKAYKRGLYAGIITTAILLTIIYLTL